MRPYVHLIYHCTERRNTPPQPRIFMKQKEEAAAHWHGEGEGRAIGPERASPSLGRSICTEWGVLSVAIFCYVFPFALRGPAWAVNNYSISQSARGTSQNIIFKTLRIDRTPHSVVEVGKEMYGHRFVCTSFVRTAASLSA